MITMIRSLAKPGLIRDPISGTGSLEGSDIVYVVVLTQYRIVIVKYNHLFVAKLSCFDRVPCPFTYILLSSKVSSVGCSPEVSYHKFFPLMLNEFYIKST